MVSREQFYTVEEFEAFVALPENSGRRFELIHGGIVEKMPTQLHAAIIFLLSGHFFVYLQQHPLVRGLVEARYQMPGDRHNARLPDLSFITQERGKLIEQGAAPYMPDLAIEVKSPDDSYKEMSEKADYYLQNGCRMVWLIYPEKRIVEVRTLDDRQLLTETDSLSGSDLLPEFTLPVHDIFPQQ